MIRIATRGSHLALAQARAVQTMLKTKAGAESELIIVKTRGDQIQAPLHLSSDEAKGFFTKEIEEALLAHQADIAVHSYKDLPTSGADGLLIAALPERIAPRDTMVFLKKHQVKDSFPWIGEDGYVGTSSLRRVSQLNYRASHLKTCDIRGNVPTRIRKMVTSEGSDTINSIILSGAGIERLQATGELIEDGLLPILEKEEILFEALRPEHMVPAPAQGTLALQCREGDSEIIPVLEKLNDPEITLVSRIERSVLAGLEGGCNLPLGVFAHRIAGGQVFGVHVYLGEEFETNRRHRSHYAYREDTDPDRLAGRVLEELLQPPTIYIFGKDDRMVELESRIPAILPDTESIRTVPAIRVMPEEWKKAEMEAARNTLSGVKRVILCLFSNSAVDILRQRFGDGESLKKELGITEKHLDVRWATTGENTARAIQTLDRGEDILMSEDGTSAGLALELQSLNNQDTAFIFLVSRNGRKELIEELRSGPASIIELPVYRSESVPLDPALIDEIKNSDESCYILAGSPLCLRNLQDSGILDEPLGIRLLCLGRTTCETAKELGLHPYAVASSPDYEQFLSEFF